MENNDYVRSEPNISQNETSPKSAASTVSLQPISARELRRQENIMYRQVNNDEHQGHMQPIEHDLVITKSSTDQQKHYSARVQRRMQQQQHNKLDQIDTTTTTTDSTNLAPAGKIQTIQQTANIVSPAGDEKLVLDPADFIVPSTASILRSKFDSSADSDEAPDISEPVVIVQETKGRFRKSTVAEAQRILQSKQQSLSESAASRPNGPKTTESRLMRLVKRVHLYAVAVSYCSYGVAAGMGLATLVLLPILPPEFNLVSTADHSNNFVAYTSQILFRFLGFYGPVAVTVSNIMTLLSTVILLHALEMRHSFQETLRKIGDQSLTSTSLAAATAAKDIHLGTLHDHGNFIEQNSNFVSEPPNHHQTDLFRALVRKRGLISIGMVMLALMVYISNLVLIPIEDRMSETVTPNGFKIAKSPYFPQGSLVNQSEPSSVAQGLDWYWGMSWSLLDQHQKQMFQSDLNLWCALNAVRGILLIFCWVLALLEIKLRSLPKH